MALLHREERETKEEWRRRIFAEAEELLRNHPDQEEVFAEMRRLRESLPKDLKLTDSVQLLREDRER